MDPDVLDLDTEAAVLAAVHQVGSNGPMHRRSFIATASVAIVAHAAESAGLATVLREDSYAGSKGGDVREVGGVRFCWCPRGKFTMGSPRNEPERRPGEDQVEVTLTKGFWMAKYEATQGDWIGITHGCPAVLILTFIRLCPRRH